MLKASRAQAGSCVLKVDLHLHSREDPLDRIVHDATALVDRASLLGFDALALTLHDSQLNDQSLREYARERDIVLLPGIERSIGGKHVLLINFTPGVEDVRHFSDITRLKSRGNGLVIAPHPFFPDRTCLGSTIDLHADLFDAVEWSYFWTRRLNFNARAARWAERHGKSLIGNSDLHDLRQLGRTFSRIDAEPDPDAICEAVRDGRVTLYTEPVPPLELAQVLGGMFWRGKRSLKSALDSVPSAGYRLSPDA